MRVCKSIVGLQILWIVVSAACLLIMNSSHEAYLRFEYSLCFVSLWAVCVSPLATFRWLVVVPSVWRTASDAERRWFALEAALDVFVLASGVALVLAQIYSA